MIFDFSEENSKKRFKRLNRLLLLCFIDAYIINNFTINSDLINYLKNFNTFITNKHNKIIFYF